MKKYIKGTQFLMPGVTFVLALILIGMLYYTYKCREQEAEQLKEVGTEVMNMQQEKEKERSLHISSIQSDTVRKDKFNLSSNSWGG